MCSAGCAMTSRRVFERCTPDATADLKPTV
jgi:hypothetical protein